MIIGEVFLFHMLQLIICVQYEVSKIISPLLRNEAEINGNSHIISSFFFFFLMQEKWGEIYHLLKAFYVPGIARCLVYRSVLITTLQDAGLYSLNGHLEMLATCLRSHSS